MAARGYPAGAHCRRIGDAGGGHGGGDGVATGIISGTLGCQSRGTPGPGRAAPLLRGVPQRAPRSRARTLRLAVSIATMPVLPRANRVRPSAETAAPPIFAPFASASETNPANRPGLELRASWAVRPTLGRLAGEMAAIRPLDPLTA